MDGNKQLLFTGILEDDTTISFVEVCQRYHVDENSLAEMVEEGLFNLEITNVKHAQFDYHACLRIQSANRLQQDLGLNVPGVVLALELLERLEQTKNELEILKRHLDQD